eukprot:11554199-Ditylum_brightwellii.AAC.1
MDLDEGDVSPSSDTDPTKQHWVMEMARAKPKTKGKNNKDQTNNDSGHKSDWYNCTCIHPGKYIACKPAETKLKSQRSNNKYMKHSH